ncbi:hypothetical protein NR798_25615 [Archangium gephyra]|uniref:hypothetical protein n=1 Tax=Archangium gephyra TaxID=48 RepID=UPI0035D45665
MSRLDLPSIDALASTIAEHLSDGHVVILRGLPSSGRTTTMDIVAEKLNSTLGIQVEKINPKTSSAEFEAVLPRAMKSAESLGFSSIVVDDFGALLRLSQGGVWQARLNSVCVDGALARHIGVLLVCGQGENVSRTGLKGSPLADAANLSLQVPCLAAAEVALSLEAEGLSDEQTKQLVSRYGCHLGLLSKAQKSPNLEVDTASLEQAILKSVSKLTLEGAERILDLARKPTHSLASMPSDLGLSSLVFHPQPGRTQLVPALEQAGISKLLIGGVDAWPSDFHESVRRFRARIHGESEVLWFDRYFGSGLRDLMKFLDALADGSERLSLRLLGSAAGTDDLPDYLLRLFRARLSHWKNKGMSVSWRLIAQEDFVEMHDRQLISLSRVDGYNLPACDRITGHQPVGNTNDSYLPRAPVSRILLAWDNSVSFI